MIYNCNKDVATTSFISGLQVTHSIYKHLVKHEVTKMRDILLWVQKYIHIEDVTQSAANRSPKKGGEGEKEATTCCTQEKPESSFQCRQQKVPSKAGKG